MNNKIGRPRNTFGSLYRRRDSRVWWMSYRDHNGRFRQESTGEGERGEAEKVLRKQPGRRFESGLGHHLTYLFSAPVCLPSHCRKTES